MLTASFENRVIEVLKKNLTNVWISSTWISNCKILTWIPNSSEFQTDRKKKLKIGDVNTKTLLTKKNELTKSTWIRAMIMYNVCWFTDKQQNYCAFLAFHNPLRPPRQRLFCPTNLFWENPPMSATEVQNPLQDPYATSLVTSVHNKIFHARRF